MAYFPYADEDPMLAPHEVSYHLAVMLFPNKFHKKSRAIDLELIRLTDDLRASGLPMADKIAAHMIEVRSEELDLGNANAQWILGVHRIHHDLIPFSQISLDSSEQKEIIQAIKWLAHPSASPTAVAFVSLVWAARLLDFVAADHPEWQWGRAVGEMASLVGDGLTQDQKNLYRPWINARLSVAKRQEPLQSDETPEQLANNLLPYLDHRIDELERAFEILYRTSPIN